MSNSIGDGGRAAALGAGEATSSYLNAAAASTRTPEEVLEARPIIVEPCEFWMVWTKSGHLPRVTHHTEERAVAEADRLARKNKGKKFIVMRAYRKAHVALLQASEGGGSSPNLSTPGALR